MRRPPGPAQEHRYQGQRRHHQVINFNTICRDISDFPALLKPKDFQVKTDIFRFDFKDIQEGPYSAVMTPTAYRPAVKIPAASCPAAKSPPAFLPTLPKSARWATFKELLEVSQLVIDQQRLYLQTKQELKLCKDRTCLFTAHRFWRPCSRNLLHQAQCQARERIKDFEAKNKTKREVIPVDYLAQSFAPVKVTPEAAHSIICQAVQGLSPGGKYINLRQADCTSR